MTRIALLSCCLPACLILGSCAVGDTKNQQHSDGSEGGACYRNKTCDKGLSCYSGLCVRVPDARPCLACKDGGTCQDAGPCPTCKDAGSCTDAAPCPPCNRDAGPCPPLPDSAPPKLDMPPTIPDMLPPTPDMLPPVPDMPPPVPDMPPPVPDIAPPQPDSSSPRKWVFITSTFHNGNFGGVGGADSFCQQRANAAALPGVYKAWLSGASHSTSPAARFTKANIPYMLVNGKVIAQDWGDLIDGTIANPINVDEFGKTGGGQFVYSYTQTNGTPGLFGKSTSTCYGTNCHCNGWTTSSSSTPNGSAVAQKTKTNDDWTDYSFGNFCGHSNFSIYCFQQ